MPRKPSKQSQRFIEFAREVGADESPEAFEETFAKIVPGKTAHTEAKQPARKPRK